MKPPAAYRVGELELDKCDPARNGNAHRRAGAAPFEEARGEVNKP